MSLERDSLLLRLEFPAVRVITIISRIFYCQLFYSCMLADFAAFANNVNWQIILQTISLHIEHEWVR